MPNLCPSYEEFIQFCRGQLTDHAASDISEHLDLCVECCETIARIDSQTNTLIEILRTAKSDFLFEQEDAFQTVCDKIRRFPSEISIPTNDDCLVVPQKLREYDLLEKIGSGGMGIVYRGRHRKLDRIVAVKLLHPDAIHNSSLLARFDREVQTVAKLDHPNMVRALDAGEVDGNHFFVMEYLDGINLSHLVQKQGPLAISDACEIICQAAKGLSDAHNHDIVHRDIKPSNLMLVVKTDKAGKSSGIVKVLDLGLALLGNLQKQTDEITTHGQVMGTLEYMSAEQCTDSHDVDHRVDIYSLGATLYTMLCGVSPFSGDQINTFGKLFKAITLDTPQPLHLRRKEIPKTLSRIVDQMLMKSPDDRPQTMADVCNALQKFTKGCHLFTLIKGSVSNVDITSNETSSVLNRDLPTTTILSTSPPKSQLKLNIRSFSIVSLSIIISVLSIYFLFNKTVQHSQTFNHDKAVDQLVKQSVDKSSAVASSATLPEVRTNANLKEGQSLDIISLLDLKRDIIQGSWEKEGTTLIVHPDPQGARKIKFPIQVIGNYSLHATYLHSNSQNLHFTFPVKDKQFVLNCFAERLRLDPVADTLAKKSDPSNGLFFREKISDNTPQHLRIDVTNRSPSLVRIQVKLNDGVVIDWQGNPKQGSLIKSDSLGDEFLLESFGVANVGKTVLESLSIKSLKPEMLERKLSDKRSVTPIKTDEMTVSPPSGKTHQHENFALKFEPGDGVSFPSIRDVTRSMTMECWLQIDHQQMKVVKHTFIFGPRGGYRLGTDSNGNLAAQFTLKNDFSELIVAHDRSIGRTNFAHLAAVRDYDHNEHRFYIDGKLIGKLKGANFTRSKFSLAGVNYQWRGKNGHGFAGVIDEVRISKVARYREEFTPKKRFESDNHTIVLYHFDEGEKDVLIDSSPHKHHGKVTGAKWVSLDSKNKKHNLDEPEPY